MIGTAVEVELSAAFTYPSTGVSMNEPPVLHLVLQNIAHGGFRLSGAGQAVDDRWDDLKARILSFGRPDIVVFNECTNWDQPNEDGTLPYVARAERDLGLALAGITRVHTLQGQPSVILYDPGTVGELATFTVPGLASPLSVAACHLNLRPGPRQIRSGSDRHPRLLPRRLRPHRCRLQRVPNRRTRP